MSAGFPIPATVKIDLEVLQKTGRINECRYETALGLEYIRVDIAQAQLDKMRIARGLQHDAKWHDLYRAINMMVAEIQNYGYIDSRAIEFSKLMLALVEIDNGVYIEPDKWSVL